MRICIEYEFETSFTWIYLSQCLKSISIQSTAGFPRIELIMTHIVVIILGCTSKFRLLDSEEPTSNRTRQYLFDGGTYHDAASSFGIVVSAGYCIPATNNPLPHHDNAGTSIRNDFPSLTVVCQIWSNFRYIHMLD